MTEKMRYSDEELQEFKELIQAKLEKANLEYERLRSSLSNLDGNDVADTSPTFKVLEEGATTLNKEEAGKLIPKERLRAVPHATLSMEAKLSEGKK